jgi:transposase
MRLCRCAMEQSSVSQEKFPLYLKEMEFRYNYRTHDLFDLLSEKLTNLAPKLL